MSDKEEKTVQGFFDPMALYFIRVTHRAHQESMSPLPFKQMYAHTQTT